jgi:glycyl-tRNA synthetase
MEEKYTPNVIEPSFGIGRILQALVEHSFNQREDLQRSYFKLPPRIAPVKCSILPVVNTEEFTDMIGEISNNLFLSAKV